MDKFLVLCEDGLCCCITPRMTVALISVLSLGVCVVDFLYPDSNTGMCPIKNCVESMRYVLMWLFQIANMMLLASSIFEKPLLVSIYVWYTLGFILMGLCVAIMDLLFVVNNEGLRGIVSFATEVMFLFMISRCLPIVNTYRKYILLLDNHWY